MPFVDLLVSAPVTTTARVLQLSGMFDVPPSERSQQSWRVEVRSTGRPSDFYVFDEDDHKSALANAVFMGKAKLVVPGSTEFDHLVKHWMDRSEHRLIDFRQSSSSLCEDLARRWCSDLGAEFLSVTIQSRKGEFGGTAQLKVKASNGVDSYEKVISGQIGTPTKVRFSAELSPDKHLHERDANLKEVCANFPDVVSSCVEQDKDVREFCRFYDERRSDELRRAGDDDRLRKKVNDDLAPTVFAEVVAFEGTTYESCRLKVEFKLQQEGKYEQILEVIPAAAQILNEPAKEKCAATGLFVPKSSLEFCQVSKGYVLKHLLVTLGDAGRRGRRDLVVACPECGKRIFTDETLTSSLSGTVACRDEFVRCAETKDLVLHRETATSAVSGLTVRRDLLFPSEKSPERFGLAREGNVCEATNRWLLIDEMDTCAVSGKIVDRDELAPSDRSGKLGLASLMVTCAETEAIMLPQETAVCAISQNRVDDRLLQSSAVSGKRALAWHMNVCDESDEVVLPGELDECQATGKWVLPSLLETSTSTGKKTVRSLLTKCEQTEQWIDKADAARSDQSGKLVASRLLVSSEKPESTLRALPNEMVVCEETGRRLLFSETETSDVSGKRVDRDLLVQSQRSGKAGLESEMIECGETHAKLLRDETGVCEISGMRVDSRLLARSGVSGRLGLGRLMGKCSATGTAAFPDELGLCEEKNSLVLLGELETCAISNQRVQRSRMVRCQRTGHWLSRKGAGKSSYSGAVVRSDLLVQSEKPGSSLVAMPDEMGQCEASGLRLVLSELERSAVSGKRTDKDLLVRSQRSGKGGLESEMATCSVTQSILLSTEGEVCSVTNHWVDSRLLSTSELSGAIAQTRLMRRCGETGKLAVLNELETCTITNKLVDAALLETCAASKKRGLRRLFLQSEVSGKPIHPNFVVRSAVSKKLALPGECVLCPWLQRHVLKSERKQCGLTKIRVAENLLNDDDELSFLRQMLDGDDSIGEPADDLISELIQLGNTHFDGLRSVRAIRSPKGAMIAVTGELRSWFGMVVRIIGLLAKTENGLDVEGNAVIGRRTNRRWELEEELPFE
jgi:hypothetical protein